MNDFMECLYYYILEYRFNGLTMRPEYQRCKIAQDLEADRLKETLTAEQWAQFQNYLEQAGELTDLSLLYMFRETLALLRGLLTV